MFINDVNKKEEIRNIAIKNLRKLDVKQRIKCFRPSTQTIKTKKLFKVPLANLENETVTLRNGQQLVIPKRLYEMCSFILSNVDTEGIFRKEGSRSRQNEIKLLLDRGCMLGIDHHVIDVAVVLKCFLRELPEPLIPFSFHELFLRCSIIEKKIEAILLACLLVPTEHLNVLTFLMQFFNEIALHAKSNKMNSYNLSLLISPNIFPLNEKMAPKNQLMIKKTCEITKIMIENANKIGLIPDSILEQVGNLQPGKLAVKTKVKRRRSASLTRIFNGLKKIVGNKNDDNQAVNTVTPDLLLTPILTVTKKNSNDHKFSKPEPGKKPLLQRRWSAITSVTNMKRKKRNSYVYKSREDSLNSSQENYVRVPKVEYEAIKNRVSAIEKRLSLELESAAKRESNVIQDIQTKYEKTLGNSEPLSPGTDQLAKRLSRELRIRNCDQKMIRSPSARKIGNIRRRSRELMRNNSVRRQNRFENDDDARVIVGPNSSEEISSSPGISDKSFSRHSSLRKERRAVRRSGNSTPKRAYVKQKCFNYDLRQFSEVNKENNPVCNTPVPMIKKTLPVKGIPKRISGTPKGTVRSTPLRVLPTTDFNYVDGM
ncbi:uncharacterized protein LOC130446807 [Diorhabda sublineata]|uniref:uncharacterized protein LOC130446807 n=1 Tax=Diorhabda sublineata TaxID=1163346 RepID=UPI0024E04A55|nr:uncharacterized protein LOC130446807 [Diorhabda sublineata]